MLKSMPIIGLAFAWGVFLAAPALTDGGETGEQKVEIVVTLQAPSEMKLADVTPLFEKLQPLAGVRISLGLLKDGTEIHADISAVGVDAAQPVAAVVKELIGAGVQKISIEIQN